MNIGPVQMDARAKSGGVPAIVCVVASVWISLNVWIGRPSSTCTMGDDDTWLAAVVATAPAAALIWFLQVRMRRRGLTHMGAWIALVCLVVVNAVTIPGVFAGLIDVSNMISHRGLCGEDFDDTYERLGWNHALSRWGTALYFVLMPLITLALSFPLVLQTGDPAKKIEAR